MIRLYNYISRFIFKKLIYMRYTARYDSIILPPFRKTKYKGRRIFLLLHKETSLILAVGESSDYITSRTLPRTHSTKFFTRAMSQSLSVHFFPFFFLKFLSISISKLLIATKYSFIEFESSHTRKKRDALLDHSCWTHLILLGYSPQYHTFIDFAFFQD